MIYRLVLPVTFFLLAFNLQAQVLFSNRNDLLSEKDVHSAVPVAIADMNGDGLDDIVTLQRGRIITVQYQTPDPERAFVRYEFPENLATGEQNDIIVADFNNDGASDIFTIGSYDRVKLLYAIPYTYSF
ncbi:MAG TPA: VCBS repeat-containing protein, partial [Saprospiraceae bacterium]|nr:VCBS repeat-containing protein [Saprospiraceae bacterium]